ncbi:MAG: amidase, partial [Synechococcaceae bacterium WB6_3B_236]|nr:amidase [Synechococcaceae bacterium WB6_3B_236]
MWKAWRRMNLPPPVIRKRLAAARRVLSFGISYALRTNNQSTTSPPLSPSPMPPFLNAPPWGLLLGLVLVGGCRQTTSAGDLPL